jgi:tryptophan-rich sensory protein
VLQSPTGAFVEIVALDLFVLATIFCFYRISKMAAAILVPYAVWLGFATAINGWIVAHLA